MFSVESAAVTQTPRGWMPVPVPGTNISCMSLGFLLRDRGDAVVWRGPKKTAMVRQFLTDTCWENVDYLLVDTPPGGLLFSTFCPFPSLVVTSNDVVGARLERKPQSAFGRHLLLLTIDWTPFPATLRDPPWSHGNKIMLTYLPAPQAPATNTFR